MTAISPLDGRYANSVNELRPYFSEFALQRYRVYVELEWYKLLFKDKIVSQDDKTIEFIQSRHEYLDSIFTNFDEDAGDRVKTIEKTTNHDVKAIEYYLKEKFDEDGTKLGDLKEYLHFSCTSEDINNLSYSLMLHHSMQEVMLPQLRSLLDRLEKISDEYSEIPMMCRTHGQSATPSTVGKEFANFAYRLRRQIHKLENIEILGKFNGATGNLNAHKVAFPDRDWLNISKNFVEGLGITWNPYTTQIECHDGVAELCLSFSLINSILIDFSRDMWGYISLGYFKQKNVAGEIGSSTMPHKINPIDFENAEGNLGLSISMFNHFAQKLPISRFQRDLSDSTVMRNLGNAFSFSMQSYKSFEKALNRIAVNENVLRQELQVHYELLAEPVQTVMRKYEDIKDPYEKLKEFTRGRETPITTLEYEEFIQSIDGMPQSEKDNLKMLTPERYTGYASYLAKNVKRI